MEVDLYYPKELHEKHNDYPMAPEKIKIEEEMLSPYSLEIKNKYDIKVGCNNILLPNVMLKKNYDVHYRNLQYYLSQRLTLTKVHRILECKQSAWVKPYIDFNTQKRKEATNEADKNLFKLFNNSLYRKPWKI